MQTWWRHRQPCAYVCVESFYFWMSPCRCRKTFLARSEITFCTDCAAQKTWHVDGIGLFIILRCFQTNKRARYHLRKLSHIVEQTAWGRLNIFILKIFSAQRWNVVRAFEGCYNWYIASLTRRNLRKTVYLMMSPGLIDYFFCRLSSYAFFLNMNSEAQRYCATGFVFTSAIVSKYPWKEHDIVIIVGTNCSIGLPISFSQWLQERQWTTKVWSIIAVWDFDTRES